MPVQGSDSSLSEKRCNMSEALGALLEAYLLLALARKWFWIHGGRAHNSKRADASQTSIVTGCAHSCTARGQSLRPLPRMHVPAPSASGASVTSRLALPLSRSLRCAD
jgi:hypothetical protein